MEIEVGGYRFQVVVVPGLPEGVAYIMPFGPARIWDEDPDSYREDLDDYRNAPRETRCVVHLQEPS